MDDCQLTTYIESDMEGLTVLQNCIQLRPAYQPSEEGSDISTCNRSPPLRDTTEIESTKLYSVNSFAYLGIFLTSTSYLDIGV